MNENEWWARQFEDNRSHLRAVAYRMLGSLSEAEDAVQEAWLRLNRSDAATIENLGGWLTTVVARVCLDTLRSRASRREEALDEAEGGASVPLAGRRAGSNPENEALLADSVGLALLVMLDRLTPAERISFVLHDMFAVSFDEIASIVGCSSTAARQLASRARRRVQGGAMASRAELSRQRKVVEAFLNAMRAGDFEGVLAVLDPEVVVRFDDPATREIHGAANWARGAMAFRRHAESVRPMLVDSGVGLVWAPQGRLARVLTFTITGSKIVTVNVIADPARLTELDLAMITE